MLQGRTALITGSTRGIGLAIARALAEQGANIMLNGFGERAEIDQLLQEFETAYKVRVRHHAANLLHPNEIFEMVEWTSAELGHVEILANNAGIQYIAPVDEFPTDKWDAVIATNLSAAFHTIHDALPFMKRNRWGRIINIASAHGVVASVNKSAYVAAKHGIVGLTKTVALETAGTGITCNAIAPGWVRTGLVEKQIEARALQAGTDIETAAKHLLLEKQPSQEFVTPQQVAQLAVFLCSDAAAQITGSTISMDGGWTAQ
jgi:3-hydroxybutyrate dehydrogenase